MQQATLLFLFSLNQIQRETVCASGKKRTLLWSCLFTLCHCSQYSQH